MRSILLVAAILLFSIAAEAQVQPVQLLCGTPPAPCTAGNPLPTTGGGSGGGGGTSSNFGAAFPSLGTAIGISNGTNMVAVTLGQAAMAASIPVALSSNQSAIPVSESGTWTVQPGNTANTTAWLVTGTGGTFPVTGTVTAVNTPQAAAARHFPGCTVTGTSAACLAASTAVNFLQVQDVSATDTIACTFGGTAILNNSGSFLLAPGQSASWGPNTGGVPTGALDCISSGSSTPAYVEYN